MLETVPSTACGVEATLFAAFRSAVCCFSACRPQGSGSGGEGHRQAELRQVDFSFIAVSHSFSKVTQRVTVKRQNTRSYTVPTVKRHSLPKEVSTSAELTYVSPSASVSVSPSACTHRRIEKSRRLRLHLALNGAALISGHKLSRTVWAQFGHKWVRCV